MTELGDDFREWREHKKKMAYKSGIDNSKVIKEFCSKNGIECKPGKNYNFILKTNFSVYDYWPSTDKLKQRNGSFSGYFKFDKNILLGGKQ